MAWVLVRKIEWTVYVKASESLFHRTRYNLLFSLETSPLEGDWLVFPIRLYLISIFQRVSHFQNLKLALTALSIWCLKFKIVLFFKK